MVPVSQHGNKSTASVMANGELYNPPTRQLPRVRLTLFDDLLHASKVNSLLVSSTLPGPQMGGKCSHIVRIFRCDAIFDFPQFLYDFISHFHVID